MSTPTGVTVDHGWESIPKRINSSIENLRQEIPTRPTDRMSAIQTSGLLYQKAS